jgi:hypothetical protein
MFSADKTPAHFVERYEEETAAAQAALDRTVTPPRARHEVCTAGG